VNLMLIGIMVGWWCGVAETRCVRSAKLFHAGPG